MKESKRVITGWETCTEWQRVLAVHCLPEERGRRSLMKAEIFLLQQLVAMWVHSGNTTTFRGKTSSLQVITKYIVTNATPYVILTILQSCAVVCIAVLSRKCNKVCWFMHRRCKIVNWSPLFGEDHKNPKPQQHNRLREKLHIHMKVMVVGVNICCVLQMAFHFLSPLQNVVMSNAWRPCGSEILLNERAWKKS